ncbi:MAG TPA: 30S ribosomal protein S13 [Candidatus Paceibacterota bacterium]
MMRIAGVTIPDDKRLDIALTYIYGVGRSRARMILAAAAVAPETKPSNVTTEEENQIRRAMEIYKIEGALKREVSSNVKRLIDIKCYRGTRHSRRLPSRGQRTRTNSRTRRGNVRKTMGSGRKKVEKK